jgi:uncharacterized protein (DUF779 family)
MPSFPRIVSSIFKAGTVVFKQNFRPATLNSCITYPEKAQILGNKDIKLPQFKKSPVEIDIKKYG